MPYMLLIVEPEGQRQERGLEAGKQSTSACSTTPNRCVSGVC